MNGSPPRSYYFSVSILCYLVQGSPIIKPPQDVRGPAEVVLSETHSDHHDLLLTAKNDAATVRTAVELVCLNPSKAFPIILIINTVNVLATHRKTTAPPKTETVGV